MDTRSTYRRIIEQVLTEYAQTPYAYGDITRQTVFDRDGDHYLLMVVGRDGIRRVHGCLIHIDLVGEKVWIQRDGTEHGIANDLLAAGVPKSQIVLAFRSPEMRQYTDFAVA